MIITTPRLTITDLRPDDEIPHTRLMLGDEFYERFLKETGAAPTSNLQSVLDHTADEEMYAIRINDAYIGWVVLQKDEQGRPDVGIKIMRAYHGHGYGSEALKAFCNWIYEKRGIVRVFARIEEANIQSQKAFAKIGAVLDERKPDYRFVKMAQKLPGETNIPELLYYHIDLPIATKGDENNAYPESQRTQLGTDRPRRLGNPLLEDQR